jgi:N-acylneuraminate cytidylyltransferase
MKTYAFVFARGGSKGLPNKNIRMLNGKPLVSWAVELSLSMPRVARVFVSTDSPVIASIGRELGAEVIDRPEHLATDNVAEWLAWQHGIEWVQSRGHTFDVFLTLPPTAPLRNAEDVDRCLSALTDDFDVVVTMTESHRNPWYNMVVKETDGRVVPVIGGPKRIARRQEAPTTYDLTTVAYVGRPSFVLSAASYWEGRVTGVLIPRSRAIDIDTEDDLIVAEALLERHRGEPRA